KITNNNNKKQVFNLNQNFVKENKYIEKVLHNVIRKVSYLNEKNTELTEDYVINLIKEESEDITKNLDSMMESLCSIKNFSTRIEEENSTFILPFINSICIPKSNTTMNTSNDFYKNFFDSNS